MTDNKDIQPVVHLNGSGHKILDQQYRDASDTLSLAIRAIPAPHARDYYPLGDDAFKKARAKYEAQVKALQEVLAQIEETHIHICDQEEA